MPDYSPNYEKKYGYYIEHLGAAFKLFLIKSHNNNKKLYFICSLLYITYYTQSFVVMVYYTNCIVNKMHGKMDSNLKQNTF